MMKKVGHRQLENENKKEDEAGKKEGEEKTRS